jgi:mannose-6-phosphate isomerase-like protein (cupin superfamily)
MSLEPTMAVNLTAIAERLQRPKASHQVLRLLERADNLVFEVQARDGAEDWPEEPSDNDAIYVIIRGEGVLRSGGEVLDCAVGDVLFAPAGAPRRFERLSHGFSTWRILLGPIVASGVSGRDV